MDFTFEPRWKEELVCWCSLGALLLDMPMGVVSVYLPSAEAWQQRAPIWARPHWEELHVQLRNWCAASSFPLHVDGSAGVYPL